MTPARFRTSTRQTNIGTCCRGRDPGHEAHQRTQEVHADPCGAPVRWTIDRRAEAESSGEREESLPDAARQRPCRLVSVGTGGVREGTEGGQADLSVDWLLDVPLVPRHAH